nr:MAG TPA: hypothetical protein [Caudoviricetes sp.]
MFYKFLFYKGFCLQKLAFAKMQKFAAKALIYICLHVYACCV